MGPVFNASFLESGCDIIPLINQGDANTDITSDWIKMRDYSRMLVLFAKYGSEQVDTLGIQFVQGTDATGAGSKALTVSRYWTKVGTMTSQGTWTAGVLTTPDDVVGFGSGATTLPSASTAIIADVNTSAFIACFDIQASDLDVDGGFDWIAVSCEGDEVNNACLLSVDAILMGGRFPQNVPLSCIA